MRGFPVSTRLVQFNWKALIFIKKHSLKEKYIRDLEEIREMMHRSSRFISLSGLSGVSAGIAALAGAGVAWDRVFSRGDYQVLHPVELSSGQLVELIFTAALTFLLATVTAIFFTTRETRKKKQKIWDIQTRRLLTNLSIPLLAGGIVCLFLLLHGFIGMAIALSLVFYGLGLLNASKYTLQELRSLGILEIILGLFSLWFIGFGLVIWAIGFGFLHIIYGVWMHIKKGS